MGRIRILVPTPPVVAEGTSTTYSLDRPLSGARVGLRLDEAWRSYLTVIDEWESRLRADGAVPVRLVTGERAGPGASQTRADLDEWSRLVDCGVIGLGN